MHLDDGARQQFLSRRIVLEDGARYRAANRDQAQVLLGLLLAVTGLVLLIACANVANLLLARVADRAAEIRVRLAIGASSAGLVRLLLVESILLGLLGAAAAVGVAGGTMAALLRLLPASDASMLQFEVNRQILLFTLALGIGSGLLFGLLPAWHGIRAAAVAGLAASPGRASATRRAARARTSLVTVQIALATVLLAQAGLFTTSLRNVSREDIGVRRAGLITFRLSPYQNGYTGEQARQFFDRLTGELRRTAGVTGVSVSSNALLSDDAGWRQNVTVEGVGDRPAAVGGVSATRIGEDYFRTLGIAMQAGREFAVADTLTTPQVAIVNDAFARRFRLGGQVVGHRLALGGGSTTVPDIEIVGLVGDAKYGRVDEAAPAQLFLAARQAPVGPLTFFARSTDPRSLLSSVPAAVASLDPNLPVERLRTLDDQIWDNVTGDRVIATLSAAFAILALLLAGIGLYAVLAYTVAQRLREIGIRMALGASIGQVRRLIVGQVSRIALVGVAAGTALAVGTGRLGEALLFGLRADDPSVLGGAAALVSVVVAVATLNPARRATSVQPAAALRAE
jgi:predicted permease